MTNHKSTWGLSPWVIAILGLLLVQLFLRAHNISVLPFFIDEDNHLRRAAVLYDFDRHPAVESHGKFLLYFLLGIFDLKQRETALHLGRTMVALTSLITTALIFTVTKRWAGIWAGLFAAVFYGLVPYALFFERMALADPFAGLWGVLTLWQSIRLAQRPTYRRAALAGLCAALTIMAKLTMAFVIGFLPLALLLLARYKTWREAWRRFMPLLLLAGSVFTLLWLPILIPARISLMTDAPDFILLNTTDLLEDDISSLSVGDKLVHTWERLWILTSPPMAVALALIALWALWKQPRRMGFLMGCLLLAWLAVTLFADDLQSRYLMSGVPLVAVILGVGIGTLIENLGLATPKLIPMGYLLAGGLLALWAALFALPAARTIMTEPHKLHMAELDHRNYFWDRYNGYGEREAMAFLQAHGERFKDQVWVLPLVRVCKMLDLFGQPNVTYRCIFGYAWLSMAEIDWQTPTLEWLTQGIPLYIMTSEQHDVPPSDPRFVWEKLATYPKPYNILEVTVWRVRLK